jgi:MFS family permease
MRELMAGLHAVRARPWVWVTLVVFSAAAAIGFAPFFVLGPAVAEQRYDSSTIFGLLVTTMGVGTFAGAILGLRWRPRRPLRTAFLVLFAWPASLAAFAIGAPFVFVLVAMVCGGAAIALFEIWWDTVMMELIPPELLSRVSAWDWLGSVGLFPISYLAFGFLAASISASSLLLIGTVGAALLLVVGLLPEDTRTVESTA